MSSAAPRSGAAAMILRMVDSSTRRSTHCRRRGSPPRLNRMFIAHSRSQDNRPARPSAATICAVVIMHVHVRVGPRTYNHACVLKEDGEARSTRENVVVVHEFRHGTQRRRLEQNMRASSAALAVRGAAAANVGATPASSCDTLSLSPLYIY